MTNRGSTGSTGVLRWWWAAAAGVTVVLGVASRQVTAMPEWVGDLLAYTAGVGAGMAVTWAVLRWERAHRK